MTAGTSRSKKPSFYGVEAGKEIVAATEPITIDVGEKNFELLTNDEGDIFVEPSSIVSSKLVNPFVVKRANSSYSLSSHVLT